MKNKFEIAQQFLNRRSEICGMARSLATNPNTVKDVGFREVLREGSLSTYRALLFALDTPISSIYSNVQQIKEGSTRRELHAFAESIYGSWDKIVRCNSEIPLQPDQAYFLSTDNADL